MGQPSTRTMGNTDIRSMRVSRVSSRSDLFPRLVAMQKLADAQNFGLEATTGPLLARQHSRPS